MSSASARIMSRVLRRQALAMHLAVPVCFGSIGLVSAVWVSTDIAIFATAVAAVVGFGIGVCLAQRLEAAASALECSVENTELLRAMAAHLLALRTIGEKNAELLRLLAENRGLTRLESNVEPANVNQR